MCILVETRLLTGFGQNMILWLSDSDYTSVFRDLWNLGLVIICLFFNIFLSLNVDYSIKQLVNSFHTIELPFSRKALIWFLRMTWVDICNFFLFTIRIYFLISQMLLNRFNKLFKFLGWNMFFIVCLSFVYYLALDEMECSCEGLSANVNGCWVSVAGLMQYRPCWVGSDVVVVGGWFFSIRIDDLTKDYLITEINSSGRIVGRKMRLK